ncbi:hypothetical protein D3C86_1847320 [compost metagenome]
MKRQALTMALAVANGVLLEVALGEDHPVDPPETTVVAAGCDGPAGLSRQPLRASRSSGAGRRSRRGFDMKVPPIYVVGCLI